MKSLNKRTLEQVQDTVPRFFFKLTSTYLQTIRSTVISRVTKTKMLIWVNTKEEVLLSLTKSSKYFHLKQNTHQNKTYRVLTKYPMWFRQKRQSSMPNQIISRRRISKIHKAGSTVFRMLLAVKVLKILHHTHNSEPIHSISLSQVLHQITVWLYLLYNIL